jgi:archaeosine synthase
LEEGTALFGSYTLYCTDETDFTRPEVNRFRERVRIRYTPPSDICGVIFYPCSAKKPYSKSRSHNLFRNTVRRSLKGKRYLIEEVILTSPLGIVPRNLEYSFPAAHYDIPVTGDWSEIEQKHLMKDLETFLIKINPEFPLVGYVKGVEGEILQKACDNQNRFIHMISQDLHSLTSKEKLQEFSTLLNQVFKNISSKRRIHTQIEFLRAIADFQFGKGIGSILIPDQVKIYGRKELGFRVQLNNQHLLTFRPKTGYLTLSLTAAELLLNHSRNIVTFDGEKIRGSTIFSKAIINADPEIRSQDEVLVIDGNGSLLAIGVANLPGNLLVKMKRGKGISIRHKVK